MNFKKWFNLAEIATNTWLTPELQSFKHTISIDNNTPLQGVFSTNSLPPTNSKRNTDFAHSKPKIRKRRKRRKN